METLVFFDIETYGLNKESFKNDENPVTVFNSQLNEFKKQGKK